MEPGRRSFLLLAGKTATAAKTMSNSWERHCSQPTTREETTYYQERRVPWQQPYRRGGGDHAPVSPLSFPLQLSKIIPSRCTRPRYFRGMFRSRTRSETMCICFVFSNKNMDRWGVCVHQYTDLRALLANVVCKQCVVSFGAVRPLGKDADGVCIVA